MPLSLHESIHVLLSVIIGLAIWRLYGKIKLSFITAFIGGILIDFDHLIDYFINYGFSFNLINFINGYQFLESGKIYIFFHGYEYVVILLIMFLFVKNNKTVKTIILALALAMLAHLIFDSMINGMYVKVYSVIERTRSGFNLKEFVPPTHYQLDIEKRKKLFGR